MQPTRRLSTALLFSALFSLPLGLTGCADDEAQETSNNPAAGEVGPEDLTDAHILRILTLANAGEVETGQMAEAKGTSEEIRGFGAQMAAEHAQANQRLNALAQQLDVTPSDSQLSRQLLETNALVAQALSAQTGAGFDLAYADAQVAAHGKTAFLGDAVLSPRAQRQELVQELATMRAAVQHHLTEIARVQGALSPSP